MAREGRDAVGQKIESRQESPLWKLLVLGVAATAALASARPYVGGWNDGSRLATVESLVDEHRLAIDHSIFVQPNHTSSGHLPYGRDEPDLLQQGTGDKLLIAGHFYSDKSPVPALLMAGLYELLEWATGWTARSRPDLFSYWLTVGTSGLAYLIAVWCLYQLGSVLSLPVRLAVTASFAFSTVALTYARHVNNHILLLGVAALLMAQASRLGSKRASGTPGRWLAFTLGGLAGLAYTIDLGAGPVLLFCTLGLVVYRCRRFAPVTLFLLAALPWLVLHHAVNYAVGGTFKPANAVPEYFNWPCCSFDTQNMTGTWNHGSIGHFLIYSAALLFGKRGFIGHNLPLYLVVPGLMLLLRKKLAERPELLYAGCCCGGVWLAYAATSNNSSGLCCSIRWFVPLLAPAYYVLILLLRQHPLQLRNFVILSLWGLVLALLMWRAGPWTRHLIPFFWPIQAAALVSLLLLSRIYRRPERTELPLSGPHLSLHSLLNADSLSRPPA
jgi:hypothetical protein